MTTVDKIWRVIWPVAVFLGINLGMQAIFSWYYVGKNIVDSNGAVSYSTQIMDDNTILIMFFTTLITIPVMIVLMKRDEDFYRFRTYKEHYEMIDWYGLLWLVPLGICMCLGITKLVTLFPIDNIIGSYEEVLESFNDSNEILRIVVLCIMVPIAEELVYRGMLYKRMKEYLDKTVAIYVAAFIFGIVHMNLVQGLYAFLCALILLYVYEKYQTILAPILLHMSVNTMAFISGEFEVFDKINSTLIAKIFFMLLELAGVVGIVLKIRKIKQEK